MSAHAAANSEERERERERHGPGGPEVWYKRHTKGGDDVDDKFDVRFAKKGGRSVFVALTVLLFACQYFAVGEGHRYLVYVLAPLTLVPLALWRWVSPRIAVKLLLGWMEKTKPKNKVSANPLEMFLGCPPTRNHYFIEGNPQDLDLSNYFQVFSRIVEVVFLCIGTNIFLARMSGALLPGVLSAHSANALEKSFDEMVMDTSIHMAPLSLIILSIFVPMLWISEDCQIYRVDDLQDPVRVGFYVRMSPFSNCLSLLGVIGAFDLAKTSAMARLGFLTGVKVAVDPNHIASMYELYSLTLTNFLQILFSSACFPFLLSWVYLFTYHASWVNTVRVTASGFLPVATIQMNFLPDEELEWLTHPEKLPILTKQRDSGVWVHTTNGRVALAVACVLTTIVCVGLAAFV